MRIKFNKAKVSLFAGLLLGVLLCANALSVNAEEHAVKAAPWMIAGAVAAFDDDDAKVKALALNKLMEMNATAVLKSRIGEIAQMLQHQGWKAQLSAMHALRAMGDAAKPYAANIIRVFMAGDVEIYSGNVAWVASVLAGADKRVDAMVVAWLKGKNRDNALWVLSEMGQAAVVYEAEIAALLQHDDAATQRSAIRLLQTMGKTQAHVPAIAGLLHDSQVRNEAIMSLAGLGEDGQAYFAEISALLKHKDADVRRNTVWALSDAGDAAGLYARAIADLIKDNDPQVRSSAIDALGALGEAGGQYAVEIAKHLKDEDRHIRHSARTALGKLKETASKALPIVVRLLKDKNPVVRAFALTTLSSMGDIATVYVSEAALLLTDDDEDVRQQAVDTIADMGEAGGKVVKAIAARLTDEVKSVRWRASLAMGKVGEQAKRSAAPMVVSLLRNNNPAIRKTALDALAEMGAIAAAYAPDIAKLLNDSEQDVRVAAVAALGKMGDAADSFATDVAALTGRGGHSFAEVLAGMSDAARKKAAPIIAGFLKDKNPNIRKEAINTLVDIGEPGHAYAAAVSELLQDGDEWVREAAVRALGKMGKPGHAYASAVEAQLQDEDPLVRYRTVVELGGADEAAGRYAPEIATLLKRDDYGAIIASYMRALGRMGEAGRAQAHSIAELLLVKNNNYYRGHGYPGHPPPDGVYADVVDVLASMGPFDTDDAVFKVLRSKGGHPDGLAKRRFLTHYLSGGKL